MNQYFLDIQQIAEYLGLKVSTVRYLVKTKNLPFMKLGRAYRFVKIEVDRWASHNRGGDIK